MKKIAVSIGGSLLLLLLVVATSTGCSGLECGEGAVEQDGECVMQADLEGGCEFGEVFDGEQCVDPEDYCDDGTEFFEGRGTCVPEFDPIECGEGTEQDGDQCVAPEPVECGSGTDQLDPRINECVPSWEACEEGTSFVEVDGEYTCVPNEDACGEETVFDDDTGLCMPEYDCQPGDVVLDGFCVPQAVELAENIDRKATGNTNPDLGGEPVELDSFAQGEELIFGGTIGEPADVDESGEYDQIVDVFEFDAQQGDWFELSVRSLGIANPAFVVLSPGGGAQGFIPPTGDETADFERRSPIDTHRDKMRQIVAPETGTYYVAVLPESVLTGGANLVGDADWDYVGTLEWIETPEAADHDFEQQAVDGILGRLDDNFFVVDDFEAGDELVVAFDETPPVADPVVAIWDDGEFYGEYDETNFEVEVPDDGELTILVDWKALYGTAGLDYELSVRPRVTLEDGESLEEVFSADDGDVVYISQDNSSDHAVDLYVTDDDGESLVDESLETTATSRIIALEEGEYTATFEQTASSDTESFIPYIDVGVQQTVVDFDTVYTGTSNEHDDVLQSYYLIEVDETSAYELELTHLGGFGVGRVFIYGLGHELLESMASNEQVSSGSPEASLIFEFEADTTYVIRVGNDITPFYADYFDYQLGFGNVDVMQPGQTVTTSVSADDGDVLEVQQDNVEDADIELTVTDGDDEIIIDDTLSAGQIQHEYPLEEGEYTATFENDTGGNIFELDTDVRIITPVEDQSFDAYDGDEIRITQDNGEEAEVELFIADESGEVVAQDSLSTFGETVFSAPGDGEFTLSYFQPGLDQAEQPLEDIEFELQFWDSVEYDTFSVQKGDIIEIDRNDDPTDPTVDVTIVDDDDDVVAGEGVGPEGFWRYHGAQEDDTYSLRIGGFDVIDSADYDLDIEVLTPDGPVVDPEPDDEFTGEANDAYFGIQSFYLVEFTETTTVELTLTHLGGGIGYGRLFVYALGDDQLERMDDQVTSSGDTESISFEFEADTPYLVRVGNDDVWDDWFDYELVFD